MSLRLLSGFSALLLPLYTAAASAGYSQSFDSLVPGTINGQDQWTANAWDVVQSATAKSGQALQVRSPSNPKAVSRPNLFAPIATVPQARLEMDINLSATASTYLGQLNKSVDFNMWITGFPTQTGDPQAVSLHYFGQTGSSGAISKDYFQAAGVNSSFANSTMPVLSDTWYHLIADLSWGSNSADLLIENADGSTFFNPPPLVMTTLHVPSNLSFSSAGPMDSSLFVDNIQVSTLPEPAGPLGGLAIVALMGRGNKRDRQIHSRGSKKIGGCS